MSRKLPGRDDWLGLLETARETTLGAEPDDAVPHGKLVSTVGDVCSTDNGSAGRWIDTAVEKGFLERRGAGLDREYVVAEGENSLHDGETIRAFLNAPADAGPSTEEIERALALTAQYYHEQLTSDIRWMIEGNWGIDSETIDRLQIGFAPKQNQLPAFLAENDVTPAAALRAGVVRANAVKHVYECSPDDCHHDLPDGLDELSYAREAGEIDAEAISLTAVLNRAQESDALSLYAWWDSRIVFPYRDESGTIRYFIARETGATDDLPRGGNKYLKLSNSKTWVNDEVAYEPIYGCETVEEGEPLLLTEGITDAITAHEAGFPCVSPVTKAFKQEHHAELLAYAETAETAHICFDSEQSGEGLDGALRTAWMLQDNGAEAFVVDLPRSEDVDKIDLAEFLMGNDAAALRELLLDVIEPEEHPAFDPTVHGDENGRTVGESDAGDDGGNTGSKKSGKYQSALYSLTIKDVVENDSRHGVSGGYRGDNPIKHVGDSHSEYFEYKKYRGEMRARDFKAQYTYSPLTWLACASGARSTRSPRGSLSDEEVWEAWRYAKEQRILDDTDPVPWAASRHLIRSHDLAPADLLQDDPWLLPPTVHNRLFELIEDEYGLNPGRDEREADHKDEQRAQFLAGGGSNGTGPSSEERSEDKGTQIKRMLATLDAMDAEN